MHMVCDRCGQSKDIDEVVRTKPYTVDRKVVCYDCMDARYGDAPMSEVTEEEHFRAKAFDKLMWKVRNPLPPPKK